LVCGFGANGRFFSERTSTRDVSRSGCCIHLRTQTQLNSPLALRVVPRDDSDPRDQRHTLFEVGWAVPEGDGWTVGASALDGTDVWALAFQSRTP
jgi:hypothetical protein